MHPTTDHSPSALPPLRLPRPSILLPITLLLSALTSLLVISAHAAENPILASLPASTPSPTPAPVHFTSQQCTQCHSVEPTLSHPTNVTPSFSLPETFPLHDSKLSCTTCHESSVDKHALARTANHSNKLLRGTSLGLAFCTQCHTTTDLSRKSQHPRALPFAHSQAPITTIANRTFNPAPRPADDGTRSCLSCHDGTIASDSYSSNTGRFSPGSAMLSNHPVAIAYTPSLFSASDSRLTPKALLDRRIQLPGGNVSCTSCHSLYSPEKKLLVMKNTESKLCLSCHTGL